MVVARPVGNGRNAALAKAIFYKCRQNSGSPFRGARVGFSGSPRRGASITRGVSIFAAPVREFRKRARYFSYRVFRARDNAGRSTVRARFSPFSGRFGPRSVSDRVPGIATRVSIPRAASGVGFSRRGDVFSDGPRARRKRFISSTFRHRYQPDWVARWFRR